MELRSIDTRHYFSETVMRQNDMGRAAGIAVVMKSKNAGGKYRKKEKNGMSQDTTHPKSEEAKVVSGGHVDGSMRSRPDLTETRLD